MEEKMQLALERKEARAALAEAVQEARQAQDLSRGQRASVEAERCSDAASKRTKQIQMTVDKNAFVVKHALAVAAAVKEKEGAGAAQASNKLAARLFAAESRRQDVLSTCCSAVERRQAVLRNLNRMEVEKEFKHVEAKRRVEGAHERHIVVIQAIKQRAEVASTKTTTAPPASSMDRLSLFSKLNDADMRRFCLRRGAVDPPVLIDLSTPASKPEHAPAGLVERLSAKRPPAAFGLGCLAVVRVEHAAGAMPLPPERQWRSSFERHEQAAARRSIALAATAAMGALLGRARPLAALLKRAQAAAARRDQLAKRAKATADAVATARTARTYAAKIMNTRVHAASVRRAVEHGARMCALRRAALKHTAAVGRRAKQLLTLSSINTRERHALAAARRAILQLTTLKKGELCDTMMKIAQANRGNHLSAVVARAKLAGMRRAVPAMLSKSRSSGEMKVVTCSPANAPSPQAAPEEEEAFEVVSAA